MPNHVGISFNNGDAANEALRGGTFAVVTRVRSINDGPTCFVTNG